PVSVTAGAGEACPAGVTTATTAAADGPAALTGAGLIGPGLRVFRRVAMREPATRSPALASDQRRRAGRAMVGSTLSVPRGRGDEDFGAVWMAAAFGAARARMRSMSARVSADG